MGRPRATVKAVDTSLVVKGGAKPKAKAKAKPKAIAQACTAKGGPAEAAPEAGEARCPVAAARASIAGLTLEHYRRGGVAELLSLLQAKEAELEDACPERKRAKAKAFVEACVAGGIDEVKRCWEHAGRPDVSKLTATITIDHEMMGPEDETCNGLDAIVRSFVDCTDPNVGNLRDVIAFLQDRGCRASQKAGDTWMNFTTLALLARQGLILEGWDDADVVLDGGIGGPQTIFQFLVSGDFGFDELSETLPFCLDLVRAGFTVDLRKLGAYMREEDTWTVAEQAKFRRQIGKALKAYDAKRRRRERWQRRGPLLCAARRAASAGLEKPGAWAALAELSTCVPPVFRNIVSFV